MAKYAFYNRLFDVPYELVNAGLDIIQIEVDPIFYIGYNRNIYGNYIFLYALIIYFN